MPNPRKRTLQCRGQRERDRARKSAHRALATRETGSPTHSIDGIQVKQETVEPPGGEEGDTVVKMEPLEGSGSEGDRSPGGSMSLDMLAQVASDRLESEPRRRPKKKPVSLLQSRQTRVKMRRGGVQSQSTLSLEQIQTLNDKLLLNLFASLESNELTRNFTYTCWLLPASCQQVFSSFGNETKAKAQVKAHLRQHIAALAGKADEEGLGTSSFSAEPLPALKKRVHDVGAKGRRGRRSDLSSKVTGGSRWSENQAAFTAIKPLRDVATTFDDKPDAMTSPPRRKYRSAKMAAATGKRSPAAVKLLRRTKAPPGVKPEGGVDSLDADIDVESVSQEAASKRESPPPDAPDHAQRESEMLIMEFLQQTQPFHDHAYTSIFGQRYRDSRDADGGGGDDEDAMSARTSALKYSKQRARDEGQADVKAVVLKLGDGARDSSDIIHIPVIKLSRAAPVTGERFGQTGSIPMTMGQEVVVEGPGERETFLGQSSRRYPPMPKCELARRGHLHIPEEDDEYTGSDEDSERRKRSIGTSECDRKMALKCIRELRSSRKKDGVPLVCKICKSKMFTATATLMYHYRSHAGIKPFACFICSETFTRQHSLNYHMLIHNNQNRFTCKDCGRKFRHPSHFKEHLRRHTGETPFSCTDCPLRFKTRNTYKRHLKTRHGKLLTAHGICSLPYDEYMKVCTRPYAQTRPVEDVKDDPGDDDSKDGLTEAKVDDVAMPASNKLLELCSQAVSQTS